MPARRSSRDEYDDVAFDDEEDWEAQVGAVALVMLPAVPRSMHPLPLTAHHPASSAGLPQGSAVQAPGLGPVFNTALRGLSAISERLTDLALQYAPADASPGVVRVAVNAGLILLALSFVKSLLSVSVGCRCGA